MSNPTLDRFDAALRAAACGFVSLLGVITAGLSALHVTHMSTWAGVVLEALLPLALAIAITVAGGSLWRSDRDTAAVGRIVVWMVVGMAAMAVVFGWTVGHQLIRGEPFHHAEFVLVNNLTAGGVIGLVIGRYDVQSRDHRAALDRQRRTVSEQHAKLAFLNNELRHHVLNGIGVILVRAERLHDRVCADGEADLAVIERRANHLATVIDRVRAVSQAFTGADDAPTTAVNLGDVLEEQLRHASESYPNVEFDATVPRGILVRADDLLGIVFENVLTNAVEHNPADSPHVDVSVDVGSDLVAVHVADNGPGFEDEHVTGTVEWEDAMAADATMGIGLAMVNALVDRYGGEVRIGGCDGEGAVVTVEFVRADRA